LFHGKLKSRFILFVSPQHRPNRKHIFQQLKTNKQTNENKREREVGGSERHYIGVGARNYFSGFEGSQAVPACPSGIGNACDRRAVL
jgi:hypothetical protein